MNNFVKSFSELPHKIFYAGITFQLYLYNNGTGDLRLYYSIVDVSPMSGHKLQYIADGTWANCFDDDKHQSFLFLEENIGTDAQLLAAIAKCKSFLVNNNLIYLTMEQLKQGYTANDLIESIKKELSHANEYYKPAAMFDSVWFYPAKGIFMYADSMVPATMIYELIARKVLVSDGLKKHQGITMFRYVLSPNKLISKKVFDEYGLSFAKFASDARQQIEEWLGDVEYLYAIKYARQYKGDPVFGNCIEFPASMIQITDN